ncbi:acetolactate synthase [Rhodococcus sp. 05-340-1]|uniref:thiamine pyrophosphate-binding protein n=1 Tax=unclassified Rhodococcus (in: high G+C Gram-positive bacteria) TaxID=192944 RepID=UPI000B9A6893|nr:MULTISPECIES: thiamine pyrophosphate-binding protein [unclassified Rhodococcus (in: high G+C Gram-positive bacteria)]OZD73386.1 acetolactate synthase [Rhodococcus sp. 05-340-2]OZD74308.1 acetolactate synthase [Rhodococcus sp. 05-340-1]
MTAHSEGSRREPTGGDVLVQVMRRHGIDTAFGVISIHNLPLVEAVARELNYVEMRHEAAVVNAADGYARASGKIGVALTSTGTGAGNAAGSMLEALTAGSRVLHITGQIDSPYLGSGRGVIHEVPKQLQMLDAVSKFAKTIVEAKGVEADLEEAIAHILSSPTGPASVEWPSDLQYLARPQDQRPFSVTTADPIEFDESEIARAVDLLAAARRPLIWVGGGAAAAKRPLTSILHKLGAGLLTSNSGRAVVGEDDDLVIGNFASDPRLGSILAEADVLLAVGTHFRSNETKSYTLALPDNIVQVDIDPAAIGRVYPAAAGIVGDATAVLTAVDAKLTEAATDATWPIEMTRTRNLVRKDLNEYIGGYADICRAIRQVLPRESVVARDVTIPSSQWGNRLLDFYERETNIFPLGGGIGQGLAMGIGASRARRDVPTVVIAGDGGLAVHLGELASLAGTEAWLIVLLFNDGGYGVLRNMQEANGLDRAGVDLFTPRFDLLAASMDMHYDLVRSTDHFEDTFSAAVRLRRPVLIEVDVTALEPAPGAFTPPVHIPTHSQ